MIDATEQSVGHEAADRAALKWKLYSPRLGQRGRSSTFHMISPHKNEPRGNEILRAVSFGTAILLYLHVAAFPIYMGYGSLMFFGVDDDYELLGNILQFSALVSLAAFCLSTQFYLRSKKREQSDQDK